MRTTPLLTFPLDTRRTTCCLAGILACLWIFCLAEKKLMAVPAVPVTGWLPIRHDCKMRTWELGSASVSRLKKGAKLLIRRQMTFCWLWGRECIFGTVGWDEGRSKMPGLQPSTKSLNYHLQLEPHTWWSWQMAQGPLSDYTEQRCVPVPWR